MPKRTSLKLKEILDEEDAGKSVLIKKLKPSNESIDEKNLLDNAGSVRLSERFFNEECLKLAKNLLGKYLIRVDKSRLSDGKQCLMIGRIVECEAYLGGDDKASHSFNGRRTKRVEAMYMKPGTVYGIFYRFHFILL